MAAKSDEKEKVEIFETGIKVNKFRFKWPIINLGDALTAGVEPCTSLISEQSIQFTTGHKFGQPTTWNLSLSYGEGTGHLLMKACPVECTANSLKKGTMSNDNSRSSYYAALEIESAGEFDVHLIEKQSYVVKVVEDPRSHVTSSLSFAYVNSPPSLLNVDSYSRPKFPFSLTIFDCNANFYKTLDKENGNLTLSIKFTQMKSYQGRESDAALVKAVVLKDENKLCNDKRNAGIPTLHCSSLVPTSKAETASISSEEKSEVSEKKKKDLAEDRVALTEFFGK